MPKVIKFYKNRALTLATAGMLTASPLSMASLGILQKPELIELPVKIIPSFAGGHGVSRFVYAARHHHDSKLTLILDADSYAEFKKAEPVRARFDPLKYQHGLWHDSEGRFEIVSESKYKLLRDDEDFNFLMLFAVQTMYDD